MKSNWGFLLMTALWLLAITGWLMAHLEANALKASGKELQAADAKLKTVITKLQADADKLQAADAKLKASCDALQKEVERVSWRLLK